MTTKPAPAPKPEGYVFGRPTKYRAEEHCALAVEMGREGKTYTQIAAAIGIDKHTLYAWGETHEDFSSALKQSRTLAQAHWEDLGYNGMKTRSIDGALYSRSMAARFPDDWRETSRQEHTGKDGGAIVTETRDAGYETLQKALELAKEAARAKPAAT